MIAVADGGSDEVRLFNEHGALLRRIGRLGGGPGEFGALAGLWALPGDTLVAYDARGYRVSYFSPDGSLLREGTLPLRSAGGPVRMMLGPFRDGTFVAGLGEWWSGEFANLDGVVRDSSLLVLVRPGADVVDTLGWTPANESYRVVLRGGGETAAMNATPPAWPVTYAALGPSRLFIAHGGQFDIYALDPVSVVGSSPFRVDRPGRSTVTRARTRSPASRMLQPTSPRATPSGSVSHSEQDPAGNGLGAARLQDSSRIPGRIRMASRPGASVAG